MVSPSNPHHSQIIPGAPPGASSHFSTTARTRAAHNAITDKSLSDDEFLIPDSTPYGEPTKRQVKHRKTENSSRLASLFNPFLPQIIPGAPPDASSHFSTTARTRAADKSLSSSDDEFPVPDDAPFRGGTEDSNSTGIASSQRRSRKRVLSHNGTIVDSASSQRAKFRRVEKIPSGPFQNPFSPQIIPGAPPGASSHSSATARTTAAHAVTDKSLSVSNDEFIAQRAFQSCIERIRDNLLKVFTISQTLYSVRLKKYLFEMDASNTQLYHTNVTSNSYRLLPDDKLIGSIEEDLVELINKLTDKSDGIVRKKLSLHYYAGRDLEYFQRTADSVPEIIHNTCDGTREVKRYMLAKSCYHLIMSEALQVLREPRPTPRFIKLKRVVDKANYDLLLPSSKNELAYCSGMSGCSLARKLAILDKMLANLKIIANLVLPVLESNELGDLEFELEQLESSFDSDLEDIHFDTRRVTKKLSGEINDKKKQLSDVLKKVLEYCEELEPELPKFLAHLKKDCQQVEKIFLYSEAESLLEFIKSNISALQAYLKLD